MHLHLAAAAFWAAFHVTTAWAGQAGHHPAKATDARATGAEVRPAAKPSSSRPCAYTSPFADYRPFTAAEPLKDWRRANEEVREAGGHVGFMKAEPKR